MANGKISGQDIIDESVFQTFDRLDKTIQDQIKRVNSLEGAMREALSGAGIAKSAKDTEDAVKKGNTALTEQEKVLREIARLKERNTQVTRESLQALQNERTRRNQINKALRDEATLSSTLSTEYQKLRKQRDQAANTLRDLVVSEKASNRELKQAQREFRKLDQRVKQADRAVGNFRDNVGNYTSALRPTIGLTRQLLGAFGVFSAIQVGQEVFDLTKQLDQLRFGLEQVTDSQEDFNRAQLFLDTLADRAGTTLIDLTRRYTNFRAAANSTTLTLKETEDIFENVVVAGSLLGRSTDDINGALRALEQILSKGKVQAEELRGQLGERLPGAFQILEKALGLANGELNELLEVGGLLSTDAIPALTRGLEDAYKLETVNRVENLAAAQARLTTEWQIFIRDLEKGTGVIGTVSKALFDFLASSIRGFAILSRSTEDNREVFDRWAQQNAFTEQMRAITEESENTGKAIDEVARSFQSDFINQINLTESRIESLREKIRLNNQELENLEGGAIATGGANLELKETGQQLADQLDAQLRILTQYKGGLEAVEQVLKDTASAQKKYNEEVVDETQTLAKLRRQLRELNNEREQVDYENERQRLNQLNAQIASTEQLIAQLTGSYKNQKEELEQLAEVGTEQFFEDLEKTLEKLLDQTIVGSAEWFEYSRALKEVQTELTNLREEAKLLGGDLSNLSDFIDLDDLNLADEIDQFLGTQGIDVVLSDFANRFKLNRENLIEEFRQLYGEDFSNFKQFEENKLKELQLIEQQKLELRQRTLDLADALSQSFLEIQLERLEQEKEKQEEIFDNVVNNKESSEEQILLAEKKRDEAEKKIEAEKAKREKQAFLFRQALAVADIFIADALARANAIASTAAIIPYIPLGAATLATLQGLITTNTALAIGTVVAQSLPKLFYKGKGIGDLYSGDAIWGELQPEVKVSKGGELEISPDGPTRTKVKSSDIIVDSLGNFAKMMSNPNSQVYARVSQGMQRRNAERLNILADNKKDWDKMAAIVGASVEKGLGKAKLSPKFQVANRDIKVRKVP